MHTALVLSGEMPTIGRSFAKFLCRKCARAKYSQATLYWVSLEVVRKGSQLLVHGEQ